MVGSPSTSLSLGKGSVPRYWYTCQHRSETVQRANKNAQIIRTLTKFRRSMCYRIYGFPSVGPGAIHERARIFLSVRHRRMCVRLWLCTTRVRVCACWCVRACDMRSCRNSPAGVNSLCPFHPLPPRRPVVGSPRTLKSTPLAGRQPPHIPRSFSFVKLPVSRGRAVFSDHRRCRLQRQHSAAGRRGWPPLAGERAEDSDAQARVTDPLSR